MHRELFGWKQAKNEYERSIFEYNFAKKLSLVFSVEKPQGAEVTLGRVIPRSFSGVGFSFQKNSLCD